MIYSSLSTVSSPRTNFWRVKRGWRQFSTFAGYVGQRKVNGVFDAMRARRTALLCVTSCLLAVNLSAAGQDVAIDKADSLVELTVKATGDSFAGKLTDYAATVLLDPETGKVTAAKVTFHFKDVKTGNEKRDREMHVWQQTDKFPDGDFTLASVVASADGKLTAQGTLTLHGVTHAIDFPVTITRQGTKVTVEGNAVVDTQLYGLPIIRKFGFLKVDPLVGVHFHLSGMVSAR